MTCPSAVYFRPVLNVIVFTLHPLIQDVADALDFVGPALGVFLENFFEHEQQIGQPTEVVQQICEHCLLGSAGTIDCV